MKRSWRKISSKIVYKNQWLKIQEDTVIRPDGKNGIYAYVIKKPANFIIAQDDNKFIYLIKEYRYPIKKTILQLPAGVADTADVLFQAKKELREETGITAKNWKNLGGFYVSPGHDATYVNVYLATNLDLTKLKTNGQENDEAIQEVVKVSIPELKKLIKNGKIECGPSISALNLLFLLPL
ncbi:NUDIX hydrolase [Patescibacteria group bacterium]|nr:NUDIX hydrolase [Patescibacteria group bacterium]